jgi:fructose-bisphosphate aldolase class I
LGAAGFADEIGGQRDECARTAAEKHHFRPAGIKARQNWPVRKPPWTQNSADASVCQLPGINARLIWREKWKFRITHKLPSQNRVDVNAHALGRYAVLCQEQGLVPIVEPEVLMEGFHVIDRCSEVTGQVLHSVFDELSRQKVALEAMLLKPNMVLSGNSCPTQASVMEVAQATFRCLQRHVPAAVPGVVFLSGGQSDVMATVHLNGINLLARRGPWKISFSYGRALQDQALVTWLGNNENSQAAQQTFYHRAKCNHAATLGRYTESMEDDLANEAAKAHRSDYEDD